MKPAFELSSPETGTTYWIYVEAPASEPGPWLPMLFTDGDDQFATAAAAYRASRKAGEIPPLLLVGVGYGASYSQPENKRGRDYTPTRHSDEPASGGADVFLKFIGQTLWPELARRYPINVNQRGIGGHSLGSLFVLHSLFQPRPFFTHHLASAPSIWWDERSILKRAAALRLKTPGLPASLFLSVGGKDSASMTGDLSLLEVQLAATPFAKLKVISQRFPARNHFNVLPEAFRAGFAALFTSPSPRRR